MKQNLFYYLLFILILSFSSLSFTQEEKNFFYFNDIKFNPSFPKSGNTLDVYASVQTDIPDTSLKIVFYDKNKPQTIETASMSEISKKDDQKEYKGVIPPVNSAASLIIKITAEFKNKEKIESGEWEIIIRKNEEYRAVWADAYSDSFLSKASAEKMVSWLRSANYNTVFVEVRKLADAYYNSKYEPRASNIKDKDYDPLKTMIDLCKGDEKTSAPIQLHAWLVAYKCGNEKKGAAGTFDLQPSLKKEWLTQTKNGDFVFEKNIFLDPGVPEVSEYLLKVILDVAEKYDIDGINLDYIRYPSDKAGYNPVSIERFKKWYNRNDVPGEKDPEWQEFRRKMVDQFLRRVKLELLLKKPKLIFSVNTTSYGDISNNDFSKTEPYLSVMQDWHNWQREGLIDLNCRMGYRKQTNDKHAKSYINWVLFALANQYQTATIIGQGNYLNTLNDTIDQMRYALDKKAAGTIQYNYYSFVEKPESAATSAQIIKKEVFSNYVNPPVLPWKKESLSGIVYGKFEKDKDIDGVTVEIKGNGYKKLTKTDYSGFYAFFNVPPGNYQICVMSKDKKNIYTEKINVKKDSIIEHEIKNK